MLINLKGKPTSKIPTLPCNNNMINMVKSKYCYVSVIVIIIMLIWMKATKKQKLNSKSFNELQQEVMNVWNNEIMMRSRSSKITNQSLNLKLVVTFGQWIVAWHG